MARRAASGGAPIAAVTGLRFALESGQGRAAVPARSALFGTALAVTIVIATLTFGSGLHTLVSHPRLYGWNWDYSLSSNGDVPPQATALLSVDPNVADWSGVSFNNAQIDGLTVPILLTHANARVTPPILSGHPVESAHQVVLGAATLAQLHKRVGDTVVVQYGTPRDAPVYVPPTRAVVVGVATLPAIGQASTLHTSMGTGAIIPIGIEPPAFRAFLHSPDRTLDGPTTVLVRLKAGVTRARAVESLRRIAAVGNEALARVPNGGGSSVEVLDVQYPAEIENYRSIGVTPVVLASGLAAGATLALALTLTASVRRRHRDMALLKALGFTQRQLTACVAWQSSITVGVGTFVGVPVGIIAGRWLWVLFANQIYAVPQPTIPTVLIVSVGLGALVLANLVAVVPGRYAARTPAGLALRAE